jgi:hypothetical protein
LIVRFSGVPADELTSALIERFGAGETEARFLAAYSEGRPGIAISLLGNEGFFEWRTRVVELAVRVASTDVRHALKLSEDLQGLSQADKETGKTQRAAMRQTLDALVLWYRDLLSLSIQGGSAQIVNSDLRGSLSSVHITPERITAAIDTLLWARKCVEGNANVQMMADVTMMRLMK